MSIVTALFPAVKLPPVADVLMLVPGHVADLGKLPSTRSGG